MEKNMDNNIVETQLNVVTQQGFVALLAMFATMTVMQDGAELHFEERKKGEVPSVHDENFEVKEYYPEGLYLVIKTTKEDDTFGYLEDFLGSVGNYMTSDDPDDLDDDEYIEYEFRLTDKIDEATHKLTALTPPDE